MVMDHLVEEGPLALAEESREVAAVRSFLEMLWDSWRFLGLFNWD